jgi:PAS domain S-box-containing protein
MPMDKSDLNGTSDKDATRNKTREEPLAGRRAPEVGAVHVSDRRQAQAALRRVTERFRLAERAANGFVYEWNPHDGIIYRSEGFERLLGYRPDEIAPTWAAWAQLIYPGDWQVTTDAEEQAYLNALPGETLENEYRMRHRDGHYLTVAEHTLIERDANGNVTRLIGQIHDITERKRAEEALRDSQRQVTEILESIADAFYAVDKDWRLTYLNRQAETLWRRPREELLGTVLWDMFPNYEDTVGYAMHVRAMGTGKMVQWETYSPHLQMWVEVRAYPSPNGLSVYFQDISERKRAEEALRGSEERLRLLIESAEDYSIFTLDATGVINSWNEGARRMFGWSAQEIIGQHGEILFTPEDRAADAPARELATALKNGRAPDERFHLRKDGSRFYVSGVMSPIHDGELRGFVKIARDLTERKRAEESLQRAHDELEQQVADRTRELTSANQRLRRLSQHILDAQEAERRLIAHELHDEIGQQLTGAKMLLDGLDAQGQEAHQHPSADQTQREEQEQAALERLHDVRALVAETLEDVRSLSLELRPAVLDSLGLVAALQWLFERYTRQTGVQVKFAVEGIEHRLPRRLEAGVYRIVQEAVTNVARHAGVAEVTVQLYLTEETLSVFIVDTGSGFDVEQALATGGSMGLTGIRERVALLSGTLTIDSLPGEGTTIQSEFPLMEAIEREAAQAGEAERDQAGELTSESHAARDRARDEARDSERDRWRDAARDAKRDTTRDALRDVTRDHARDARRGVFHEQQRKESEP